MLFGIYLLTLVISCSDGKKSAAISNGVGSDTLIKHNVNGFRERCNRIPTISLSGSMSNIYFKPLTGEEATESGSYQFDEELGQPLGKIDRKNFVVLIYSAPISGDMKIIQTYTLNGDEISRQSLLASEDIDDLDDPDTRCESTGLKMDKDLNVYCYYKDAYVKKNSKDTVVKSFVEKYYKIDDAGKIAEIKK